MVAEAAGPLTRTSLRVANAWRLCVLLGTRNLVGHEISMADESGPSNRREYHNEG
jgi:hypothetical protein